MAADEIHVGDVGTVFKVTVKDGSTIIPVNNALIKEIIFKKPGGLKVVQVASFFTDGLDGILTWTVISSTELDIDGLWCLQAHVQLDDDNDYSTDVTPFRIYPNI